MAFYFFWKKNTQRLVLANEKKNGIKVKNSRMSPRVQRQEKVIGVGLTFSAAFPFGRAGFQVALNQKAKKKVISEIFRVI